MVSNTQALSSAKPENEKSIRCVFIAQAKSETRLGLIALYWVPFPVFLFVYLHIKLKTTGTIEPGQYENLTVDLQTTRPLDVYKGGTDGVY